MSCEQLTIPFDEEQWRMIPGHLNYEASSLGRVRRIRPGLGTYVGRILQPAMSSSGYLTCLLYNNGKRVSVNLHAIIALTFLGPCPKGKEINHKNGIKVDCRAANLEHLTPSENMRHAFRTKLRVNKQGEDSHRAKFTNDQVREIRKLLVEGVLQRVIAEKFSTSQQRISEIKREKSWKHIR